MYTTSSSPYLDGLAVGDQVQLTATVNEWYGQCVLAPRTAPRRMLCVSALSGRGVQL